METNFISFLVGTIIGLLVVLFLGKNPREKSTKENLKELAENSHENVPKTTYEDLKKEVEEDAERAKKEGKSKAQQAEDLSNAINDAVDFLKRR